MSPDNDDICKRHSKHTAILDQHEKRLDTNHSDHGEMWTAIKGKVDFKLFSLLVLLVVGNLGFQMAIYNTVKDTEKDIAVIKAEIKTCDPIEENNGKN